MHRILIVDDEITIRTMLLDFLEGRYEVATAENADTALALCEKRPFDMVISDINMPGMKGPELLAEIKRRSPGTRTVLITAYNVDDYIRLARKSGVSNIIPKTSPFNFPELDALVDGLLTGNIFGIGRYLLPQHTLLGEFCIRSSAEAREVREAAVNLLTKRLGGAGDMQLVLDEIVTNAVYHAPTFPDGTEKYEEFSDVALSPQEYVRLECAFDAEKYGVAVIDNRGRLTKDTVLYKIERQLSGAGAFDDSGRGLHMSRLFSDRMIINIEPKKKTEVILINYFSHKYRGYKPLYINEL
ncbi:MAG TPA: response regulator [Chitinivibrionales bacterium]|nr:response regulator [Chitinivibrionales bacterium]